MYVLSLFPDAYLIRRADLFIYDEKKEIHTLTQLIPSSSRLLLDRVCICVNSLFLTVFGSVMTYVATAIAAMTPNAIPVFFLHPFGSGYHPPAGDHTSFGYPPPAMACLFRSSTVVYSLLDSLVLMLLFLFYHLFTRIFARVCVCVCVCVCEGNLSMCPPLVLSCWCLCAMSAVASRSAACVSAPAHLAAAQASTEDTPSF